MLTNEEVKDLAEMAKRLKQLSTTQMQGQQRNRLKTAAAHIELVVTSEQRRNSPRGWTYVIA